MPTRAKIYVGLTIPIGAAVILYALYSWQSDIPMRFISYLVLALLASCCKVRLPGIPGTMSVNYLFILLGVVELSFSETILMGCACIVLQSVWKPKRSPKPLQTAFNVASITIATALSYFMFHLSGGSWSQTSTYLLLCLASSAYFLTNTGMVVVIVALTEGKQLMKTWKECYFWSFPYYLMGAGVVGLLSGFHVNTSWLTTWFLAPILYWIYRSYRQYLSRLEDETEHAKQIADLHLRTIEALALAIEAKDQNTHNHVRRVETYAVEVGKELGLSEEELRALRAGAILHDIGKLGVPEHIISKPGKLTSVEFEKMKTHPVIGCQILEQVRFPYPVAPIVRSHHERWDGTGYPDGLRGEEIPIGARILSAVDCLDALSSDRQYRRALTLDAAMATIASQSGTGYDPRVVATLLRRYPELEVLAQQHTAAGVRLAHDAKLGIGAAPAAGFAPELAETSAGQFRFIDAIAAARQEVQSLFELTKELGSSLSLSETLSLLGTRLRRLIPYDSIAIYTFSDGLLKPGFASGENSQIFAPVKMGEGISGWVAENREPIVNANPCVEPFFVDDAEGVGSLRSALSVPLEGPSGLAGVLTLYQYQKDAFTTEHLRLLQAITYKMAQAIQNALEFSQATVNATTDALTRLPNARSLFLHLDQELARSKRSGQPLSVLVCDLDGFKAVNDNFGHLEGNKVLRLVAQELKECCREYDYVARMGGDEFVLVLSDLPQNMVASMQIRLARAVAELGRTLHHQNSLGISIGEAHFPKDGADAERLLAEADRRMYAVKQGHRQYPQLVWGLSCESVLVQ
jgi:diguanylate cyclase (GGDEF)-like protein/putative nucleotidyltransferase with HDIG domain